MPRLAEELEAGAEEVVLEVGSVSRFGGRVGDTDDDDDDSEDELDVAELLTLLDELVLVDDEEEATLLDELVEDAETLAGDEVLEEPDDVDCEPTGPVPVETM